MDIALGAARARVAILGPGGIGKTTIALQALHHPSIRQRYGDRRFFVSCESATSAQDVIRMLTKTIGCQSKSGLGWRHSLIAQLQSCGGIICLDHFDAPWEADTAEVEDLLSEIDSISSIAVILTSRLTDMPLIRWSYPRLPIVLPLKVEDALGIWDSICHGHDSYARLLVEAVDCLPLAVTLLARLSRTESSRVVWDRWQTEKITLVRSIGKAHRLNSLEVSIRLSVEALVDQDAIHFLRLLSVFPKGLRECDILRWEKALIHDINVRRVLAVLKQHSLVQTQERLVHSCMIASKTVIKVLSPMRHYMNQHYQMPHTLFLSLGDIYCNTGHRFPHNLDTTVAYLKVGLAQDETRERCLQVIAQTDKETCCILYPQSLLLSAVQKASRYYSSSERAMWIRMSTMWERKANYEQACTSILCAIDCAQRADNAQAEHDDWEELARLNAAAAWSSGPSPSILTTETRLEYLREAQYALDRAYQLASSNHQVQVRLDDCGWELKGLIAKRRRAALRLTTSRKSYIVDCGKVSMSVTAERYRLGRVVRQFRIVGSKGNGEKSSVPSAISY